MANQYLLDVSSPQTIFDSLECEPEGAVFLEGNLPITSHRSNNVTEPEGLGYIHLPRDKPTYGARLATRKGERVLLDISKDLADVASKRATHYIPISHVGGFPLPIIRCAEPMEFHSARRKLRTLRV